MDESGSNQNQGKDRTSISLSLHEPNVRHPQILVVEDSKTDVVLIREAISSAQVDADLYVVSDGEAATGFFHSADSDSDAPCPTLVVLDLNLPKKNGDDVRSKSGARIWRNFCFLLYALYALVRIDDPEVLDDLEFAILCLGDVHVHANVMLTRHHFSRAARTLRDLCVVQRPDNFVLV